MRVPSSLSDIIVDEKGKYTWQEHLVKTKTGVMFHQAKNYEGQGSFVPLAKEERQERDITVELKLLTAGTLMSSHPICVRTHFSYKLPFLWYFVLSAL